MKFPRSIRNRMMNAVARLGVSLGMGKRDISLNTDQTVGSNWISMHSLSCFTDGSMRVSVWRTYVTSLVMKLSVSDHPVRVFKSP